MSLKVTLSNNRVLCDCAFPGHSTRDSWTEGVYFQNYKKNKCEGNENKITLSDFHITMDKMDKDGGNKT